MTSARSAHLQRLLDRLRDGDRAARNELITECCTRLRRLAAHMFSADFARLRGQHDTTSILDRGVLRLMEALDAVQPCSVGHFFQLAALKMRQVLLDLARAHRPGAAGASPSSTGGAADAPARGADLSERAAWAEVHARVDAELSEQQRAIIDLCVYHGYTQAEAAALLGITPKQASRLWRAARLKLARWLAPWKDGSFGKE